MCARTERLDGEGPDALVRLSEPVSKFPQSVHSIPFAVGSREAGRLGVRARRPRRTVHTAPDGALNNQWPKRSRDGKYKLEIRLQL